MKISLVIASGRVSFWLRWTLSSSLLQAFVSAQWPRVACLSVTCLSLFKEPSQDICRHDEVEIDAFLQSSLPDFFRIRLPPSGLSCIDSSRPHSAGFCSHTRLNNSSHLSDITVISMHMEYPSHVRGI